MNPGERGFTGSIHGGREQRRTYTVMCSNSDTGRTPTHIFPVNDEIILVAITYNAPRAADN
jgi:hypothetical protein